MIESYITKQEIEGLLRAQPDSLQKQVYDKMHQRVMENMISGMPKWEKDVQQEGDHLVWSRLSEACFIYRMTSDEQLGQWIHKIIMEIVYLSEEAWIGPSFGKQLSGQKASTLEIADIAHAICEACLNAEDVFSEDERNLINQVLADKALVLLEKHIDKMYENKDYVTNNWFMPVNCAYGMTAAILGRKKEVQRSLEGFKSCLEFYNNDSCSETLQYTEYVSANIGFLGEILYRLGYIKEEEIPMEPLSNMLPWYVASIQDVQYVTEEDAFIPIAFNFGDSNLHMRFHADMLIQIGVRMREKCPWKAGLASWLFALPYEKGVEGNRTYCTDFYGISYLGLLMLSDMAPPITPEDAKVPLVNRFENGQVIVRDSWKNPRMMLAIAAGSKEMNISSHRHPDQNSFLLTVGKEQMLIDPVFLCSRLWSCKNACSERSHSVISLFRGQDMLPQHLVSTKFGVDSGRYFNEMKVFECFQDTLILVSDVAKLYESTKVEMAVRIWVICMPNMMFVADYILAKIPLCLETNFVLNNEDNKLLTHVYNTQRLVLRRGAEAMKLFMVLNSTDGKDTQTELVSDWTFAHHHSSRQPNSPEQVKEGSGQIYRWTCKEKGLEHRRVHSLMFDEEKNIKWWHMIQEDDFIRLEAPDHENTLDFKFTEDGFAVRRKGSTGFWKLNV